MGAGSSIYSSLLPIIWASGRRKTSVLWQVLNPIFLFQPKKIIQSQSTAGTQSKAASNLSVRRYKWSQWRLHAWVAPPRAGTAKIPTEFTRGSFGTFACSATPQLSPCPLPRNKISPILGLSCWLWGHPSHGDPPCLQPLVTPPRSEMGTAPSELLPNSPQSLQAHCLGLNKVFPRSGRWLPWQTPLPPWAKYRGWMEPTHTSGSRQLPAAWKLNLIILYSDCVLLKISVRHRMCLWYFTMHPQHTAS